MGAAPESTLLLPGRGGVATADQGTRRAALAQESQGHSYLRVPSAVKGGPFRGNYSLHLLWLSLLKYIPQIFRDVNA